MNSERQQCIEIFDKHAFLLKDYDIPSVTRPSYGNLSLDKYAIDLRSIISTINEIRSTISLLSTKTIKELTNFIRDFYNKLNEIIDLNPDDYGRLRDINKLDVEAYIDQFRDLRNEFAFALADKKLESYFEKFNSLELSSKTLNENKLLYSELLDATKSQLGEAEKQKKEYESAVVKFKDQYDPVISKAEILYNSAHFKEISDSYKKQSKWWFCGVIIAIIILIFTVILLVCHFKIDLHYINHYAELGKNNIDKLVSFEIAKNLSFRVVCVSIATFIVGFSVKNYNSCKHNETIYYHKASSLNAALQLIDKVKTDEGKDNLMIQASLAIFSHQPTGYGKRDVENIPIGLVDNIKNLASIKANTQLPS